MIKIKKYIKYIRKGILENINKSSFGFGFLAVL